MVKRLFVFSDMQFDASLVRSREGWETTHDRIVKAYKRAGYEMPEIVYWNLRGGTTKPVLKVRTNRAYHDLSYNLYDRSTSLGHPWYRSCHRVLG